MTDARCPLCVSSAANKVAPCRPGSAYIHLRMPGARCVFAVLRDRTPYRDPDTDDEAQVQAPAALQTRVGVSFRQSPTLQPLTLK